MNELERALVGLGRELAVPDAPDLAPPVLAALEPRREPRPEPRRRLPVSRRWALAVAVAVLAVLGATLAIPDARSALFRVLSIGGERIEIVDELPNVEPVDLESTLGERVTLDEARTRSAFELRELDEEPDRVYLGERETVWFLYGTPTDVRLLVAQTPRLLLDEPGLRKKLSGEGTQVEQVTVNGARGVFLSGEPHFLYLLDENGFAVEASPRLAQNVLVWEDGGVAYRLEGRFDREQALDLARDLR
jgi:hypothetical protein